MMSGTVWDSPGCMVFTAWLSTDGISRNPIRMSWSSNNLRINTYFLILIYCNFSYDQRDRETTESHPALTHLNGNFPIGLLYVHNKNEVVYINICSRGKANEGNMVVENYPNSFTGPKSK